MDDFPVSTMKNKMTPEKNPNQFQITLLIVCDELKILKNSRVGTKIYMENPKV